MEFTDNCDGFAAIHENVAFDLVRHGVGI